MTLHVGPLPAGDERHLKALKGAGKPVFLPEWAAGVVVDTYHRSLAEQGVRLVDASEVVAFVRELAGSSYPEKRGKLHDIADDILARFGGGDEG